MEKFFNINGTGYSIRCMLYCNDPRNIRSVILALHGFGGHKENRATARFAEAVLSKYKKTAILAFDLPCHGEDARKKLTLEDCDTYIGAVTEYVTEQYSPDWISVYATSFGGYLTLKYLQEHGNPFHRIVLRCPAIPMHEVFLQSVIEPLQLEKLQAGKPVLVGFDRKVEISLPFLQELTEQDISAMDFMEFAEQIRIIHGTKDEIVPMKNTEKFCDDNVIEFFPITNADHRFTDPQLMSLAIKYALEFLFSVT